MIPSWSLTFPNGRQFKPGFNVTASRVATHQLIVGLTPITPPGPPDLSAIHAIYKGKNVIVGRRVCVTNDDELGQCWVGDEALHKAMLDSKKAVADAESALRTTEVESLAMPGTAELKQKMNEKMNEARNNLKDAKEKLEAAKARARDRGVQIEQAKFAHRQSVREARADTQRRLQQIVQEQILRNAFRQ